MKTNEFVLIKDNILSYYKAIAVLYSEDTNRGFIIYDEGEKKENRTVLKIGEILLENEEIFIEELNNKQEADEIWEKFKKIYKQEFIGG